jgi:hypothetical protein
MIAVRQYVGSTRQTRRRADQAAVLVVPLTRPGSLIGNRHGFPFSANSTPRLAEAGSQSSKAIAKIIDHMNPDGRIT